MKKRMFLTTALMALVLLVAVTTATFAWYQASTTGTITPQDKSHNVGTSSEVYEVGALTITVNFDGTITNLGPVDTDGNVKFLNSKGQEVYNKKYNVQNYYDTYGSVTWSVYAEIGGEEASSADLSAYVGTKFTVIFSGDNLRVTENENKVTKTENAGEGYINEDITEVSFTVIISQTGSFVLFVDDAETATPAGGNLFVSIHNEYTDSSDDNDLTLKAELALAN